MATLRKWQPARVAPRRNKIPERALILAAALTTSWIAYALMQWRTPHEAPLAVHLPQTQAQSRNAALARERAALAAAREKYDQEHAARKPHVEKVKAEQARAQAALFHQRHGTDRMPVGSLNAGEPAAPRSPGFIEVKPGLTAAMPGASHPAFGFREIRKWQPGN